MVLSGVSDEREDLQLAVSLLTDALSDVARFVQDTVGSRFIAIGRIEAPVASPGAVPR